MTMRSLAPPPVCDFHTFTLSMFLSPVFTVSVLSMQYLIPLSSSFVLQSVDDSYIPCYRYFIKLYSTFFFYCIFSKDSAPTFTVNPMAVGGGSICASITCFFFFFPLAGCFTVAVLPPTVRIINILTTTVAAVFSPCCSLVLRAQASSFHITFFLYKFLFCM